MIFLTIWKKTGKEKPPYKRSMVKIHRFHNPIDAWNFVTENKITHYAVFEAKCVIDLSGGI